MHKIAYFFIVGFIFFSCQVNQVRVIDLEYHHTNCEIEKITRVYLNDSILLDYSWSNDTLKQDGKALRIDTFKVVNHKWYLKRCGEYSIYFDRELFKSRDTIFINDRDCSPILGLVPLSIEDINGKALYQFQVIEPHYNFFAPKIWFDPDFGITRIISKASRCEESKLEIISNRLVKKKFAKELGILD